MAITRRDFLKYTATVGGGLLLGIGIFDLKPIVAYAEDNPPVWTSEAITVCGYCSVGCSMIAGKAISGPLLGYVTYVQGNPDSPINKGALCSKGSASAQFSTVVYASTELSGDYINYKREINPNRLTTVKYRAGGATAWTSTTWDAAIAAIAGKVKATRDANFVEMEGGITVNRCTGIGVLGGSCLNNEPAYLISKLMRAVGVVYLETQARN
jgi:formate dehydrogenase major subunit